MSDQPLESIINGLGIGFRERFNANNNLKLCIIGHKRHGKSTVAKIIKYVYGLSFSDSSYACASIFIFDELNGKYNYQKDGMTKSEGIQACFEDRVNHRKEWFDLICGFNAEDPTRLAREIMRTHSIYCGMRSVTELTQCIKDEVFNGVIWVIDKRKPDETGSFDIPFGIQNYTIQNNGTIEDLVIKTVDAIEHIKGKVN